MTPSRPSTTSLTVIVPVYNERYLVAASLERLLILADCPRLHRVQVIVVDDGSKDGSDTIVADYVAQRQADGGILEWQVSPHAVNQGKGAAVRTGLALATCELTVIHDADLECHPEDLPELLVPFLESDADAVYGSRFLSRATHRVLFYRHELGNRFLTFLANLASNYGFTDMETCYKVIRTELWQSIPMESHDFRMEPEITIKLAKRGAQVFEVPIRYSGRTYHDGKKINWKDGFRAISAIARFAVSDNLYVEDGSGRQLMARLSRMRRYARWIASEVRPHLGDRVLEVGAGMGAVTAALLPRPRYLATDKNPVFVTQLQGLAANRPYMAVAQADVAQADSLPQESFDTVVCLHVLEHVTDDAAALQHLADVLEPGGRLIVLAPRGPWLMGALDRRLSRHRRYAREGLQALALAAGLEVERVSPFNRLGALAWLLQSKLLALGTVGLVTARWLDSLIPIARILEPILPWPSLSWLLIARRPPGEGTGAEKKDAL